MKPTFGIYSQDSSKFKPILTLTVKKKWNKTLWRTTLVIECSFLGTKMQKSRCKLQARVYLCNLNAETVGTVTQVVACLGGGIVFAREFWWRSRHTKPQEASAEGARKFVSPHSLHDFAAPLPTLSARGRSRRLRRLFNRCQAFVCCCALHESHAQRKVLEALSQTITGLVLWRSSVFLLDWQTSPLHFRDWNGI